MKNEAGLEETLANHILMMIAGNMDRWHPDDNSEEGMEVVRCAQLTAQGIAQKLNLALTVEVAVITSERWRQLVQAACQGAFIELPAEGVLVRIGENPSFVRAVEAATVRVVAPPGSVWRRKLELEEEAALRAQLRKYNVPPREIKRMIAEVRAKRG